MLDTANVESQEPYQIAPPLSDDEYSALKSDIEARGVLIPVEYDDDGNILDGHHRVKICGELGIETWPRMVRKGMSENAKRAHARVLNFSRRHLSSAAKREMIAGQLRETPEKSNNSIAGMFGCDHKTVGVVRVELEGRGEIPNVTKREDSLGRKQPATKSKADEPLVEKPAGFSFEDDSEEGELAALDRAKTVRKRKTRGVTGTGENEWYTPNHLIDKARAVLGGIDVDPASNDAAQKEVKAKKYFTEQTNGLDKDWKGRVWMNPPYAQPLISEFCNKLLSEIEAGNCTNAVTLTHNYTDTKWFHALSEKASAICFTRGRVKFYSPSGEIAAPTQGQAFCYFGEDVEGFAREFSDVGFVVEVRK